MDEISFKEAADEAGDEACASGAAFSPDAAIHWTRVSSTVSTLPSRSSCVVTANTRLSQRQST